MRIESILNQLPGYVFWKDCDSNYIGANKAFHDLAGLKNKTISGKDDFQMPWEALAESYRGDDQTAIDQNGITTIEFVNTHQGYVIGQVEKRPIIEDHKVIGVSCNLIPYVNNQKTVEVPVNAKALRHLFNSITPREAEVLYYTVRGFSMRHIGETLCLSPKTIEAHLENIKYKFQATSKTDLINTAMNMGFMHCIPSSLV